jgi:hypothetical protein
MQSSAQRLPHASTSKCQTSAESSLSKLISRDTTPREAQRQMAFVGNFDGSLEASSEVRSQADVHQTVGCSVYTSSVTPGQRPVHTIQSRSSSNHRTDPRRLVHQENGLFKPTEFPRPNVPALGRATLPSKRGHDAPYPDQGYIAHLSLSLRCIAKLIGFCTANARLLFPASQAVGATQLVCEIGVMAVSGDQEKHTATMQRGYTAVLTIPTGTGRNWTVAAKGESRESIVAALQSLFEVTAMALEKFQGNVFKSQSTPSEIAGGIIDESLVKTTKDSSWTSMFGLGCSWQFSVKAVNAQ